MAKYEYTELTDEMKLSLARSLIRKQEEEHYQLSLSDAPDKAERLAEIEAQIDVIRPELEAQKAKEEERIAEIAAAFEAEQAAAAVRDAELAEHPLPERTVAQ